MGTNYYIHKNCCPHCQRGDDRVHIGKSSAGWCFSLRVYDDIKSLEDWKVEFAKEGVVIRDEYGDQVTSADMVSRITERASSRKLGVNTDPYPEGLIGGHYATWGDFYRANEAEPGPNNLLRHKIGRFCVGHGEGTWDLFEREFS
jgi:hypothetical protein